MEVRSRKSSPELESSLDLKALKEVVQKKADELGLKLNFYPKHKIKDILPNIDGKIELAFSS